MAVNETETEVIDFYDPGIELAGDHMKLEHQPDGSAVLSFQKENTGRKCGSCTLCCKLLPIPRPPLHKPAGVRCQHQRHSGCSIYKNRPIACRTWACRWLIDPDTAGMKRPDRSHYVIDMTGDYVTLEYEGGRRDRVPVVQVWVDPAYPDAYKAPELRAYMLDMATRFRNATIIRYNSREAFTIFPPPLASDGEWHEKRDGSIVNRSALDEQVMLDLQVYEEGQLKP